MAAAAKFLFDADFSAAGRAEADSKVTATAHAVAVAEAEQRGYRQGVAAVEARDRTEAERRCAAAFERIAASLQGLGSSLDALERKLEAEAIEVATAIAGKLAPALMAREPVAEIAALAASCLAELRAAPHVAIRIHESLQPELRPQLEAIARSRGFEGRLVVLGETHIAPGDCRIEWADGGVVRNRAAAEIAIAELVNRYVAARAPAAMR